MILLYPGSKAERLQDYYTVLKDYPVIPFGDVLEEMQMKEITQKAKEFADNISGEKEPVLFFTEETPEQISQLISALEEADLKTRRMAVMTPNNQDWTFKDLYEELSREAAYFEKREKLVSVVEHADKKRMMEDEKYGRTIFAFYQMLQEPELADEMLDMALDVAASLEANE